MSLKAKIEAVLFMTEKPLRAQAIAGIVGEDVQVVRQALLDLIHEYEERQGGLEIADEDGYSFQVKDSYSNLMDEFLPIEMTNAVLRTLSAIAIKQPIPQAEIIKVRGATAYDHIKELVSRELILKREDEKSRSPMLSTTKKFQEYFRLTKDGKSLRQYLKREIKKKEKEEQLSLFPTPAGGAMEPDLQAGENMAPPTTEFTAVATQSSLVETAALELSDPELSSVKAAFMETPALDASAVSAVNAAAAELVADAGQSLSNELMSFAPGSAGAPPSSKEQFAASDELEVQPTTTVAAATIEPSVEPSSN